jgi:hypothetical protein
MKEFGLPSVHTIWPFYLRDSSLSCLYRMYEWLVTRRSISGIIQHGKWKTSPIRRIRIQSVMQPSQRSLALAFNERIDMGILRVGFHVETSTARKFRMTLSREEFESYTASQHERPPAWTTCAQGPSALFTFRNGSGHIPTFYQAEC